MESFFVQWLSPQYIQNYNQLSSVRATIPLIYGVFGQEMTRRYDKMFQFSSMEEFTCALFKDFEQIYRIFIARIGRLLLWNMFMKTGGLTR